MATRTRRDLTALAAGVLSFVSLHTGAADLPARLLVDPSDAAQVEKEAFKRGAIVVFGSRTIDPATGQPFNVQILEGGNAARGTSGEEDRTRNDVSRFVERPAQDPAAGQVLNISVQYVRARARWAVFVSGFIDPGAPDRMAAELTRQNVPTADVYLDSPGGSVGAGIALGRMFRRYKMSTYIGSNDGTREPYGRCYSACVYAYIGGTSRYMKEADSLGIHRFTAGAPSEHDLERAQLVSAEIARYISDMGVDLKLFQIASRIPSASMYRLNVKDAITLRVANNGR